MCILRSPVLPAVQVVKIAASHAANQTGTYQKVSVSSLSPEERNTVTYREQKSFDRTISQCIHDRWEEVLESHCEN